MELIGKYRKIFRSFSCWLNIYIYIYIYIHIYIYNTLPSLSFELLLDVLTQQKVSVVQTLLTHPTQQKILKNLKCSIVSNFRNKKNCEPILLVFYLDLLRDMNMHLLVEEETCGVVSIINHPLVRVNLNGMEDYNEIQSSKYLFYLLPSICRISFVTIFANLQFYMCGKNCFGLSWVSVVSTERPNFRTWLGRSCFVCKQHDYKRNKKLINCFLQILDNIFHHVLYICDRILNWAIM